MDSVRALLTLGLFTISCAHTQPHAAAACGERREALNVARKCLAQTESSDGVTLRLDESRISDEPDRWEIWTLVGQGRRFGEEASLVVRKGDCSCDWQPIQYEM